MWLLLDIGNTSVKWACLADGAPGPMGSVRHHGALPVDLLAAWDGLTGVTGLLIGRVGPPAVEAAVRKTAAALWQSQVQRVSTLAVAHGVRVAYPEPARLGVDRFLALIGAHWFGTTPPGIGSAGADPVAAAASAVPPADTTGPRLIVDAGTAITFDLLGADGRHFGGLILPGVNAMREALFAATQLPRCEPTSIIPPWATDTAEAIAAGSLQAPAALAGRLYRQLAAHTGATPLLLLTGGDAERLLPALDIPATLVPDLVLRGLARFVTDAGPMV